MWKELKFSKPFDDTPILFLDISEAESRTPLRSWTNDEQNGAALKIAQKIQSHLPGRLTKLCYYNSILRDLRARKLSLPCYTVDSYMSRETDLVLLLTTRTNTGLTEKTGRFFFDQNRLIVALTKAKEGVIVLDSQRLLEKFPLWKKLFSELIKRIEIVSPEKFIGYLNRWICPIIVIVILLLIWIFYWASGVSMNSWNLLLISQPYSFVKINRI